MIAAAHAAGVAVVGNRMPMFHSWTQVRTALPGMLTTLARQGNALGVFA